MGDSSRHQESPQRTFRTIDELEGAVGDSWGPTSWRTVDQATVDGFATLTDDWQPLHDDPASPQAAAVGGTIAHGYLLVSMLSSFARELYRVEGVAAVLNYGIDRLRFPAPTPVGSRVAATATLRSVQSRGHRTLVGVDYEVTVESSDVPSLVAQTIIALEPARRRS